MIMTAANERRPVSDLVNYFNLASPAAPTDAQYFKGEVQTTPLLRQHTLSWWTILSVWMRQWIARVAMAIKDATMSLIFLLDDEMFPVP